MKTTLGILTGLAILSAAVPAPAQAPVDASAEQATYRVNIAGRQRMLSQRIAKAACLRAIGADAATYDAQLAAAHTLFSATDQALRAGDPAQDLPPERFNTVIAALEALTPSVMAYDRLIARTQAAPDLDAEAMLALDEVAVDVLTRMNAAVNTMARAYGSVTPDVPLALTITVDVAGRQRMLTQKAVKEACLMRVADDPAIYAERLAGTVQIFDLSLDALQTGFADAGVLAAPTPEVEEGLAEVEALWLPVKAVLDGAAGGVVLDQQALRDLAVATEPLLARMNAVVGLYELVDPATLTGTN